jgi:hypothetical protein
VFGWLKRVTGLGAPAGQAPAWGPDGPLTSASPSMGVHSVRMGPQAVRRRGCGLCRKIRDPACAGQVPPGRDVSAGLARPLAGRAQSR